MFFEFFSYKVIDSISIRFPRLFFFINSIINAIIIKDDNSYLFIPHQNCKNDRYDIFNSASDNVLVLFNRIFSDEKLQNKHLYVVYYHREKLNDYQQYCKSKYNGTIEFIYYEDNYHTLKAFFVSKLIFTDNFYLLFPYKSKKQKVVCLGYYSAPFKDDYYKIEQLGSKTSKYRKLIEKTYDYHICTSDISSRLISLDSLIPYSRFLAFGMPRNDVFYCDNSNYKKKLLASIGVSAKYIFIYVPTHRDYESEKRIFFDEKKAVKRSIWGYESENEIKSLDVLLEKTNSIVIVKIHPDQARNILATEKSKRIILYSDIIEKIPTSLNEMMAISDFMISDYTTAAYDFMCVDRPIIYYWYDIDKYINTRGFSINPIEPLCPGPIVYNLKELREVMARVIAGKDEFKIQRDFVSNLIFKDKDNKSADRIIDFFLKK